MLTKLTGYGIRGHLFRWIKAFLSSRSQSVKIDHFLSSPSYVKSGVPKGSVLGPILFLISIANRRIYLTRRCFRSKDVGCLTKAYVVFVRPLLEYCSPVWCPSYKYLVDAVESVQRRFTKYLPGFSSVSYSERLKRLKFDSLELRRLYIDLTLCFKNCNGYVALDKNDFFAFNP